MVVWGENKAVYLEFARYYSVISTKLYFKPLKKNTLSNTEYNTPCPVEIMGAHLIQRTQHARLFLRDQYCYSRTKE